MKLGEALTRRKDLSKQIVEVRARARAAMQIEYDYTGHPVKPVTDDAVALVQKHDDLQSEMRDLILKINLTNSQCQVPGRPMMIAGAIAERDYLGAQIKAYGEILTATVSNVDRYDYNDTTPSKYEIAKMQKDGIDTDKLATTTESVLDYADVAAKLDRFSKQHREIDVALQEANWTTDLI